MFISPAIESAISPAFFDAERVTKASPVVPVSTVQSSVKCSSLPVDPSSHSIKCVEVQNIQVVPSDPALSVQKTVAEAPIPVSPLPKIPVPEVGQIENAGDQESAVIHEDPSSEPVGWNSWFRGKTTQACSGMGRGIMTAKDGTLWAVSKAATTTKDGTLWAVGKAATTAKDGTFWVAGKTAQILTRKVQQYTCDFGQGACMKALSNPQDQRDLVRVLGKELVKGLRWSAAHVEGAQPDFKEFIKRHISDDAIQQGIRFAVVKLDQRALEPEVLSESEDEFCDAQSELTEEFMEDDFFYDAQEYTRVERITNTLTPVIRDYVAESLSHVFAENLKSYSEWSESESGAREIYSLLTWSMSLFVESMASESEQNPERVDEKIEAFLAPAIKQFLDKGIAGIPEKVSQVRKNIGNDPVANNVLNDALLKVMPDLLEMADGNLNEILSVFQGVVNKALVKAQSGLVAEALEWGMNNPRTLEALPEHIFETVAKGLSAEFRKRYYFGPTVGMIKGGLKLFLIWLPNMVNRFLKNQITDTIEVYINKALNIAERQISDTVRGRLIRTKDAINKCPEGGDVLALLTPEITATPNEEPLNQGYPQAIPSSQNEEPENTHFSQFYNELKLELASPLPEIGESYPEVVETVTDPDHTAPASVPRKDSAEGFLQSIIPGFSRGVTAVVRQALDTLRQKMRGDADRLKAGADAAPSAMSVLPVVTPFIQDMIQEVAEQNIPHVIDVLDGSEDEDLIKLAVSSAAAEHINSILCAVLEPTILAGAEKACDVLEANLDGYQTMLEDGLMFSIDRAFERYENKIGQERLNHIVSDFKDASIDTLNEDDKKAFEAAADIILVQLTINPGALPEADVKFLLSCPLLTKKQAAIIKANRDIQSNIDLLENIRSDVLEDSFDRQTGRKAFGLRNYQRNITLALVSGNELIVSRLMRLFNTFLEEYNLSREPSNADELDNAAAVRIKDETVWVNNVREQIDHLVNVLPVKLVIEETLDNTMRSFAEMALESLPDQGGTPNAQMKTAATALLKHVVRSGVGWAHGEMKHSESPVGRIQQITREKLGAIQSAMTKGVAVWLSQEKNAESLVSAFVKNVHEELTHTVVEALSHRMGADMSELKRALVPSIDVIVEQTLERSGTRCVQWAGQFIHDHEQSVSSLAEPYINSVVEAQKGYVVQAAKEYFLLEASQEARHLNFNVLAADVAELFAKKEIDPEKLSSGYVKVEPAEIIPDVLPKVLCFLAQTAEMYQRMGGELEGSVDLQKLSFGDLELGPLTVVFKPGDDGRVNIERMTGLVTGLPNECRALSFDVRNVTFDYRLPELSPLKQAALISAASTMPPEKTAPALFDAFFPEMVTVGIGEVEGNLGKQEKSDGQIREVAHGERFGFSLANALLKVNFTKHYPKLKQDVSIQPDNQNPSATVVCTCEDSGYLKSAELMFKFDGDRTGAVEAVGVVDTGKIHWLLGWIVGTLNIRSSFHVEGGAVSLSSDRYELSVEAEGLLARPVCSSLIQNSLNSGESKVVEQTDGTHAFALKLRLFSEQSSYQVVRWFAKMLNGALSLFVPSTIEIPLPYAGISKMPEGESGLGVLNLNQFIDGISPVPVSLDCPQYDANLERIKVALSDKDDLSLEREVHEWQSNVEYEIQQGSKSSVHRLLRAAPQEAFMVLIGELKKSEDEQKLQNLLWMLVFLADAEPEKAMALLNAVSPHSRDRVSDRKAKEPWLQRVVSNVINEHLFSEDLQGCLLALMRLREYGVRNPGSPLPESATKLLVNPEQVKRVSQNVADHATKMSDVVEKVMPPSVMHLLNPEFELGTKLISTVPAHSASAGIRDVSGSSSSIQPQNDDEERPKSSGVLEDLLKGHTSRGVEDELLSSLEGQKLRPWAM